MQFAKIFKTFFVLSVVFIIVACGGGGGQSPANTGNTGNTISSSSSSVSIPTASQTFSFVKQGTHELTPGDIFVNQATGQGTGLVTYSSSDTKVAEVDSDGIVSIVGGGSVDITARIAEDKTYSAAAATYKISATKDIVGFTAWVGRKDSDITFPASMKGFDFFRGTTTKCNSTNIKTCLDSQHTVLNDTKISDSTTTLSQGSYYLLSNNSLQANVTVDVNSKTPKGLTSNVVVFKGEMLFLVSKISYGSSYEGKPDIRLNSIYSSTDGINWHLKTEQLPFSYREKAALVVFNEQLWLVGGAKTNDPTKNDVWVSSDGATWTEKPQISPFTARANHHVVVFNNQLWVIGGESRISTYDADDVWSSSDGANWLLKSKPTFTSWTRELSCVVFNNKMWSLQGSKVWSSLDGITWQLETDNGPLTDELKAGNEFLVFDNKLWVFPANPYDAPTKSKVFVSENGIDWVKKTVLTPFTSTLVKATVFKDQIWLMGTDISTYEDTYVGTTGNYITWSSYDGARWRERDLSANFKAKFGQTAQSVGNNLLLFDLYEPNYSNNISQYMWISRDGLHWDRNQVQGPIIEKARQWMRSNAQWVHHNGRLLYITEGSGGLAIYSTENGLTWTFNRTDNKRKNASVVSFKQKLFMIGGLNEGVLTNSILSSADGTIWTREPDLASFKYQWQPVLKALSNKIILLGGKSIYGDGDGGGDGMVLKDIWISEDGTHWTQTISDATSLSAVARAAFLDPENIAVFEDKLWFITTAEDYPNGYKNQLWSSTDGINWTLEPQLPFSGRNYFHLVNHANKLWVIGGTNSFSPNDISWATNKEVWNTTDGIEWKQGYKGLLEFK